KYRDEICLRIYIYFFFQAEDGIRDRNVTGVQTCALPIFMIRSNISEGTFPVMHEFIDFIIEEFVDDPRFKMHFVSVKNLKGDQSGDIHLCDTKELFPFYNHAEKKGFDFSFYKQTLQPGGSECYVALPDSFVIGSDGMV